MGDDFVFISQWKRAIWFINLFEKYTRSQVNKTMIADDLVFIEWWLSIILFSLTNVGVFGPTTIY